jgi:hypothetical protein
MNIQRAKGGSALKLSLTLIVVGMGITASAATAIVHGQNPNPWAIKLTGTVTDTACGTPTHEALVPGDALCVRTCVGLGADYALATNRTTYVLSGHRAELYEYAGEKVQIKGERIRDTIIVESVVPVVMEASRGVN